MRLFDLGYFSFLPSLCTAGAVFAGCLLFPAIANSEIFTCKATYTWGGPKDDSMTMTSTYKIVVPEEMDYFLGGIPNKPPHSPSKFVDFRRIGIGLIEVIHSQGGQQTKPDRYDFVQTKKGGGGSSLFGFFVFPSGGMVVFRVDLWKKEKPFYAYDSQTIHTKVIQGYCE